MGLFGGNNDNRIRNLNLKISNLHLSNLELSVERLHISFLQKERYMMGLVKADEYKEFLDTLFKKEVETLEKLNAMNESKRIDKEG